LFQPIQQQKCITQCVQSQDKIEIMYTKTSWSIKNSLTIWAETSTTRNWWKQN